MTDTKDLAALKAAARKAASANRKLARVQAGADAAQVIAEQFLHQISPTPDRIVSAFLSIGSEVDTAPLIAAVRASGCVLCLPCVIAPETPLVFRVWHDGDALVEESFGTRAPEATAPAVAPDILVVPLLAYDAAGYRLGYGGGFYDRSLEQLRLAKGQGAVTAVGIGYSGQQIDAVPRGTYDQPLDWIVTEQGAFRPNSDH